MKKDHTKTAIWEYFLKVEEKHFKQQEKFDGDYPKMNKYEQEYFEACQMAEEIKQACL